MRQFSQGEKREVMECAIEVANAAGREALRHFRLPALDVESKGESGFDPVTIADRKAEEAMRAIIARRRPQDGVLGEEFGPRAGESPWTWVLDPIDGTRGYICGTPTWGVLVGLRDADGPILGVIGQPHIGEIFIGGLGEARLEGPRPQPLATRPPRALGEATLLSTFPEVGTGAEAAAFQALSRQCRLTRYGMDCYGYALLALGQVDLVVEAGLQEYDVVAPIAVVQAAGGIVTNWRGGPAHEGGRVLAAANPEIHAAALEVLAQAEGG